MMNATTDVLSNNVINPLYTLIIGFFISVILLLLNELAKRRYLIAEKLLSLRLERFESLLQELYSYAAIYEDIKMIFNVETANVPIEAKAKIVNFNRFFEKLFSKPILKEDDVWGADTSQKLEEQKWKLMNFLQTEGLKIFNNIQYKASALHLIMPIDRDIQVKSNKIADDISNYIAKIKVDENDYSYKIRGDLKNLVDSMRTYLPSLSLINWFSNNPNSTEIVVNAKSGLTVIIKKLADCYFKRIPDVLLVVFAFGMSLSLTSEGKDYLLSYIQNFRLYLLVILLTLPIAVLDYNLNWYRETYLK